MFKGSLVALVTPFDGNNRVDYASLKRLIEFHVEHGTNGLVIAGTTGESATLTRSEHIELVGRALEIADGRLPIIAGTGSNSTAQTIELSLAVADPRIAAYLVVVPYYNKPTQEGLFQHFTAIADAVDKPVMMYNVPGRTVADMLPKTVARLAAHDNIFGIKEATGDLGRLAAIQDLVDDSFMLYSGDDFTLRPFIEQGGHGVVTVSGNVAPKQVAELCRLSLAGQADEASALDETLQPLNKALFVESNPIPVKWAVSELGLMAPHIRLPLTRYSEQYHERMRAAMRTAGVVTKDTE
ncbi:MAG: 4-hydroxy-tetrahydrodipicolinate synthase [Gammaproteobacteria bacterium]|nr:4-hydroxy-tetrahydrodipicolinate synthase [Gammaproteobacteria bacterium]